MRFLLIFLLLSVMLRVQHARADTTFVRVDTTANNAVVHVFTEVIVDASPDSLVALQWPSRDTLKLYGVKYSRVEAVDSLRALPDSIVRPMEYRLVGDSLIAL